MRDWGLGFSALPKTQTPDSQLQNKGIGFWYGSSPETREREIEREITRLRERKTVMEIQRLLFRTMSLEVISMDSFLSHEVEAFPLHSSCPVWFSHLQIC